MPEWRTEAVQDCLLRLPLRTAAKLQTQDYRSTGLYPIIDQGQALIAGWTDDDSGLISANLPVVVFGDHTRVLKFVDFPFVRGADGTQILKPRAGIDPLYFYYACRAIDLPSRGYNRHFKALKEKEISVPPDEEQRCIAESLKLLDEALSLQDVELQATENCRRAAMRALFTRGLRGEAQKETDVGLVPESWTVGRLDRYATVVSTRMSYSELESLQSADDGEAVKVLGIKVADMNLPGNEVELAAALLEKRVPRAIAQHRCAPPRTIIFPKRGAAIATNKKRISNEWTAFDPNVIGVVGGNGLDQSFLFHWFQTFDLRTITEPGPTPQLNKKNLEPLIIPVPPTLDEQNEIVAVLEAIDRKIDLHRRKRAVLDDLFKALLHQLMTGEIRIPDLDLSVLGPKPIPEAAAT
jgi:type I restriction enzyme S subunit